MANIDLVSEKDQLDSLVLILERLLLSISYACGAHVDIIEEKDFTVYQLKTVERCWKICSVEWRSYLPFRLGHHQDWNLSLGEGPQDMNHEAKVFRRRQRAVGRIRRPWFFHQVGQWDIDKGW